MTVQIFQQVNGGTVYIDTSQVCATRHMTSRKGDSILVYLCGGGQIPLYWEREWFPNEDGDYPDIESIAEHLIGANPTREYKPECPSDPNCHGMHGKDYHA